MGVAAVELKKSLGDVLSHLMLNKQHFSSPLCGFPFSVLLPGVFEIALFGNLL